MLKPKVRQFVVAHSLIEWEYMFLMQLTWCLVEICIYIPDKIILNLFINLVIFSKVKTWLVENWFIQLLQIAESTIITCNDWIKQ